MWSCYVCLFDLEVHPLCESISFVSRVILSYYYVLDWVKIICVTLFYQELAPNDISLTLEDVQLIIGILYCVGTVEISPQRIETLLICAQVLYPCSKTLTKQFQVLGIPTLISFLKKIRDSIQDGGKGLCVKKQIPAPAAAAGFLAPSLLPTAACHKLARPETEVVYFQVGNNYLKFGGLICSFFNTAVKSNALGKLPKKTFYLGISFPNLFTHPPTPGFLWDLGKQNVKFR